MTCVPKACLLGIAALAVVAPAAAQATFPGTNGKIAYTCIKGAFSATHDPREICTVKPGAAGVRLTTNGLEDQNPAFSADGREIAFEEDRKTSSCSQGPSFPCGDIYRMRADGSGLKRLTTTGSTSETDPTWSPNGKQIAYVKNPFSNGGQNARIVVMRASDGTILRTLGKGIEPNWSPNGKMIAFAKGDHVWCVGASCVGGYGIYTMNASDGSGQAMLTSTTHYADGTPCDVNEGCPETNGNPNWSPGGGAIAWDIFDSKAQTGYIDRMSASGGGKSPLVPAGTVPGCPQHPAWSPDGTRVAFSNGTYCASGGNPPSVYVRAVSGGVATKVAAGSQPDWGAKP